MQKKLIAVLEHHGDPYALIDRLCDGDKSAAAELRSLYEAAVQCDENGFLSDSPLDVEAQEKHDENLLGSCLGAYRLKQVIGRGGMGTVYLADRIDGQYQFQAAIKIMSHHIDGKAVERFKSERQILAGMNHPHIARLLDGGELQDGRPYLVMEWVDGTPISEFCDNNALTWQQRLRLFLQLCEAVQYAHSQGIVHRDLKPANVLVTCSGEVKLLDFGIARSLHIDPNHYTMQFTPSYAAPEQMMGGTISAATDQYACGLILYSLLTGQRPQMTMQLSLATDLTHLPKGIKSILSKALDFDPENRYESVEAFTQALSAWLTNKSRSPGRASNWIAAAFVGMVAAMIIGVFYFQDTRGISSCTYVDSTTQALFPHVQCMLDEANKLMGAGESSEALAVLHDLEAILVKNRPLPLSVKIQRSQYLALAAEANARMGYWDQAIRSQRRYIRSLKKYDVDKKSQAFTVLADYFTKAGRLNRAEAVLRRAKRMSNNFASHP